MREPPLLGLHFYTRCLLVLAVSCFDHADSDQVLREVAAHPNWRLVDQGTKCGRSSQYRIVGGKEASLGEYPWVARLGYSFDLGLGEDTVFYQCGGALISARYVLTAAHCSPETVGRPLTVVRLGDHDDRTDPDCSAAACAPPALDAPVEEVRCHKGFDGVDLHDDICLVRLAAAPPIAFSRFVAPVCLPVYETFRARDFGKTMLEVAGWGVVDTYTMLTSDVLMKLKVPIRSNAECQKKYAGRTQIVSTQLCAGGVVGKDSCVGDSGGPLMKVAAVGGRPRYFAVGVVSFGPKYCAESDTPGVYTNVVDYLPWILDNVRE